MNSYIITMATAFTMTVLELWTRTVAFIVAHQIGIVSFIALVFSLAGNTLINFKRKIGFIIWIISNVLWIAVNLMMESPNWSQIAMFIVYMMLNIHGWITWSRKMQ